MNESYETVTDFVEDLPREVNDVVICGTTYSDTGGVSRVIEQQATDLSDNGYSVRIYALNATTQPPPGVDIDAIGRFETTPYKELDKLLTLVSPRGLKTLRALRSADVVITHRFPFSVLSYLAKQADGPEYVFWSHPSQSSDHLFDGAARVWAKLQHHLETGHLTVRGADHICAVSEESRSYIQSKVNRDVILVQNSISESRFDSVRSRESIESEYGIDASDKVVLHVGRITPRKSILELVDSFERIADDHDGLKLVLVGKENMQEYSERVRERAGDDVIFTGFVDDDTLAGLYDRSDVYATCSLSEGWGLPLSEATYFETPIVAYESIPAAKSIEDAHLAREGDQADFETQLRSVLENV